MTPIFPFVCCEKQETYKPWHLEILYHYHKKTDEKASLSKGVVRAQWHARQF